MKATSELNPKIAARLLAQAQANSMALKNYILRAVDEAVLPSSSAFGGGGI